MINLLEELKMLGGGEINPMVFSAIELGIKIHPFYFQISRKQTEIILESVPEVFPEDMGIRNYNRIPYRQKRAYKKIAEAENNPCPIPIIVEVIRIGLDLRESLRRNSQARINACFSGKPIPGLTILERPEIVAKL